MGCSQHPPRWAGASTSAPFLRFGTAGDAAAGLGPSGTQFPGPESNAFDIAAKCVWGGSGVFESRWIFPRLRGEVVTAGDILAAALLCPSAALTSPAGTDPQTPQLPLLVLVDVISKHPNCRLTTHPPISRRKTFLSSGCFGLL